MGQKTNPKIFQLSKTSNWQSKCFEKKLAEYSKYSKKDLEIRSFIEKFFKTRSRTVHYCKICYFEKSLHIFVSYHLNAKLSSLFHGSIPSLNRFKTRRRWKEPCRISQLPRLKCRIVKSYLKQTHHKIKYPIKTSKLMRYKIVHQMLEDIQMLRKMGLNYLKEGLNALHVILRQYKKINSDLPLNLQHLIKSTELLQQLTLTLCNKKLRSRREKENKLVGALKNVLTEKMTESLQCFTSRNVALWIHLKALNLNRNKKIRRKVKDILKKNLIKLRKYKEEKFYREGVEMLLTCSIIRKPAALLAQFLAIKLKTLKKHNFFLKFIKEGLKLFSTTILSKTKRIKIKIKGRLNARPKAKSRVLKVGKDVAVLTICSDIDYSEKTAFTSNGTLGIKVWIHEFLK